MFLWYCSCCPIQQSYPHYQEGNDLSEVTATHFFFYFWEKAGGGCFCLLVLGQLIFFLSDPFNQEDYPNLNLKYVRLHYCGLSHVGYRQMFSWKHLFVLSGFLFPHLQWSLKVSEQGIHPSIPPIFYPFCAL